VSAPEPVAVKALGELAGERNLPGALHVLVAGQSAGGAERVGAEWRATWYTAVFRVKTASSLGRCCCYPTNLFPLRELHEVHNSCKFPTVFAPFWLKGTMWS
jgi:hypothetical protein